MSTDILPNFFIAGVPKAGTSSVHAWLAAHPQALGSRQKETCFFADKDSHTYDPDFNILSGLELYQDAFDVPGGGAPKVIFESTPSYLYQKAALQNIPTLKSAPKCLFILREPAQQIRSVYRYYQNNWNHIAPDFGFDEYLKAVRAGQGQFRGNELAENAIDNAQYIKHLRPWRAALGPDRLKVMTFEAVIESPKQAMKELALWLDIDPGFYQDFAFVGENESYVPKSRALQSINVAMRRLLPKGQFYTAARSIYRKINTSRSGGNDASPQAMAKLHAEFAPFNQELASELGVDTTLWDQSPSI